MNALIAPHITCGKCGGKHHSVFEVRVCYGIVQNQQCASTMPHDFHQNGNFLCNGVRAQPAAVEHKGLTMVTERQLEYINDLGGDVEAAKQYTMRGASLYIERLKKEKRGMTLDPQWAAPNRQQTKVPIDMLKEVRDGYYAVQPDSNTPHTFFRVSRPKAGRYKGLLKVQTQHGPDYKLMMIVRGDDTVSVYNKSVEDELLLVVVDQIGSAIAYAEKIGKCMRCNTELTDERSRYYGIGPECEKHWPHIVPQQDDRKGPYVPGAGL